MSEFQEQIQRMNKDFQEHNEKLKILKESELFVLDNSLRESTVGQLRGHTIENKWKIYNEVSLPFMNAINPATPKSAKNPNSRKISNFLL